MSRSKVFGLLGLCCWAALPASAQSLGPAALTAAGTSSTASGITHEFAVGQVVAGPAYSSNDLVVTPGVLQPVFDATAVAPRMLPLSDLNVYPSPVATTLYLQPALKGSGRLVCTLYDAGGRIVQRREAVLSSGTELQEMPMTGIATGAYNLQVSWTQGGETALRAFRIQKIQ